MLFRVLSKANDAWCFARYRRCVDSGPGPRHFQHQQSQDRNQLCPAQSNIPQAGRSTSLQVRGGKEDSSQVIRGSTGAIRVDFQRQNLQGELPGRNSTKGSDAHGPASSERANESGKQQRSRSKTNNVLDAENPSCYYFPCRCKRPRKVLAQSQTSYK